MAVAISIFGVAVAAFCLWLTVRIVNRRERWAKWMAVIVALVGYPLSFGPVCWLAGRNLIDLHCVAVSYQPVVYAAAIDPTHILASWVNCGTPDDGIIFYLIYYLNYTQNRGQLRGLNDRRSRRCAL